MACFCELLKGGHVEQLTADHMKLIVDMYERLFLQGRLYTSKRKFTVPYPEAFPRPIHRPNKRPRLISEPHVQPPVSSVAPVARLASRRLSPATVRATLSVNSSPTADTTSASPDFTILPSPSIVLPSPRSTPARTCSTGQGEPDGPTQQLLSRCEEETIPLLKKLLLGGPVQFMKVENVDVKNKIQCQSTSKSDNGLSGLVAAYECLKTTSTHCQMLKWMLALQFHRMLRGRHIATEGNLKHFRTIGRVADNMSRCAGNVSIVLLVPFASWIKLNEMDIKDTVKRLSAHSSFLGYLRQYEGVTKELLAYIKGDIQFRPIIPGSKTNPSLWQPNQALQSSPASDLGTRYKPQTQPMDSDGQQSKHRNDTDSLVSPAISHLLPFLVCLDPGKISIDLLEAGSSSVKRWNDNGESTDYSPEADGINEYLRAIFRSSEELDRAVSCLKNANHICAHPTESRMISVLPETVSEQEQLLTEQGKLLYWREQAVRFVGRLFHEQDAISPRPLSLDSIKKDLLPHLEAMDRRYSPMGWPKHAADVCIRLLCAGSLYKDLIWKESMLEKADRFSNHEALTTSSSVMLALRKAKVYRLRGEAGECDRVLKKAQGLLPELSTASAHTRAQSGLLSISLAESFTHRDLLDSAIEQLQNFQAQAPPQSSFETTIQLRMWIMEGKIRRYKGDFARSEELLDQSLDVISENNIFSGLRREALQELADLYIEIKPEKVQSLTSEGPQQAPLRLRIADAESLLELGKLDVARTKFEDLRVALEVSTKHFCLLRVNVGLARIYHQQCWDNPENAPLDSAIKAWCAVLKILTDHFKAWGQGRTTAIVLLSSCDVASMRGGNDAAETAMNQVHRPQRNDQNMPDLHQRYASQYWIPGLGNKFYERVKESLKNQDWDLDTLKKKQSR